MTAYALMGDITTPLLFVLIGTIVAYFNKNMIIILVISLVFSNILKFGTKISVDEGFTDKEKTEEDTAEKTDEKTDTTTTNKPDNSAKTTAKKTATTTTTTTPTPTTKTGKSITPDLLANTQESFENLYSLQKQIEESMKTLNAELSSAEKIVEKLETTFVKK
jgi:hypothetical protein